MIDNVASRTLLVLLRLAMAWVFLYAASHQVFAAWSVSGFLGSTKTFHWLFAPLTAPALATALTLLVGYGHLLIGLSLLSGLLVREHLMKAIDEDGLFGDWAEAPMEVARYELRGPNRQVSERPTILEMLALRRAAQRVVELTEMLLLSLTPVVSGRTGPLKFAVSIVGP